MADPFNARLRAVDFFAYYSVIALLKQFQNGLEFWSLIGHRIEHIEWCSITEGHLAVPLLHLLNRIFFNDSFHSFRKNENVVTIDHLILA